MENNSPYLNFPLQIEILTLLAHLLPFAKKKHFNSSLPGLFHEPESPPLTLSTVCTFPKLTPTLPLHDLLGFPNLSYSCQKKLAKRG